MTTWNRTAGDVNDSIVAYLYGVTGSVASSEAHVWVTGGVASTLTASTVAGTDQSGTACLVCTVSLGTWLSGLTPTSRTTYNVEHEVTFADGKILTWPSDAPDYIVVRPQGD